MYRSIERVAVWKLKAERPLNTYRWLLAALRDAMGHWYAGINADVKSVQKMILGLLSDPCVQYKQHVTIRNSVLMIGTIVK